MNRFLHDDLRPKNTTFSLGKLEEIKEISYRVNDVTKKLSDNRHISQKDELTLPEITAYPKLGLEITKPFLLFSG